jgi:type VI protein secretion system component Hcp
VLASAQGECALGNAARSEGKFAPSGSAAASPGAATTLGGEQSPNASLAAGGQSRPGPSNLPGTIACSALEFSVSVRDATGKAMGRASTSPIVCRKAADQVAVQLIEEAATGRRIANLTLSWQNQIAVKLTEAEVTGVQFKVDNGAEIVEITFAYQKVELEHTPSGTHVAL